MLEGLSNSGSSGLSVHEGFMARCLNLAQSSLASRETPRGSLLVKDGLVVAEGEQRVRRNGDVTAHSEVVALRDAQQRLGTRDFSGSTLYTACEPCPMCSYTARRFKIGRVVYSIDSPNFGGASRWNILEDPNVGHTPEEYAPIQVTDGVLYNQTVDLYRKADLMHRLAKRS